MINQFYSLSVNAAAFDESKKMTTGLKMDQSSTEASHKISYFEEFGNAHKSISVPIGTNQLESQNSFYNVIVENGYASFSSPAVVDEHEKSSIVTSETTFNNDEPTSKAKSMVGVSGTKLQMGYKSFSSSFEGTVSDGSFAGYSFVPSVLIHSDSTNVALTSGSIEDPAMPKISQHFQGELSDGFVSFSEANVLLIMMMPTFLPNYFQTPDNLSFSFFLCQFLF